MARPRVYEDVNAKQAAYRERLRRREAVAERARLIELQTTCSHHRGGFVKFDCNCHDREGKPAAYWFFVCQICGARVVLQTVRAPIVQTALPIT